MTDQPVITNHEVWTTCPVCGYDYDARNGECCGSAGLTMTVKI